MSKLHGVGTARARIMAFGLGALTSLASVSGGGTLAREYTPPPDLTVEDRTVAPEAFRIARERLATQQSHPFLLLGRVMDETQPRWREFRRAIRDYPDVDSCLVVEERGGPKPDLLAFDWGGVSLGHAMDVCLFRVFQSLGEPQLIEAWLLQQGFRTTGFYDPQSKLDYSASTIGATWSSDQYFTRVMATRLPRPLWEIFSIAHMYGLTLNVGKTGDVTSIQFGPVTK